MRLAPHPMTLRQLQYAVAVAELRSFHRAAEACHVSQPSLSAQIAQLEETLGVPLFERDRKRVLLTHAGNDLLARARRLLLDADDLVDAAARLIDPLTGTLRVGIIPTIAPYLLPEIVPVLRTTYPKLTLVWREEKTGVLLSQLTKGDLEAAVVALEAELGDVEHEVIGRDPFVLATPPESALGQNPAPATAEDLHGARVLHLEEGHCFGEQSFAFCSQVGAEELGFRATSLPTLAQMVAGGAGITLLPLLAVPNENRQESLRIRPFADPAPARTLALVWRKQSPLAAGLGRLGGTLREAYEDLAKRLQSSLAPAKSGRRSARKT